MGLNRMRWLVFFIMTGLMTPAFSDASEFGLIERDYGVAYGVFTGDVLTHRYEIRVPSYMQLSPSSLPAKGPLEYWLELRSVRHELLESSQQVRRYQLILEFQTFYAPLDVRQLQTPSFVVSFNLDNSEDIQPLTIPSWSFTMSPLKQIAQQGVATFDARTEFMKPDMPPDFIDITLWQTTARVAFLTALILLIAWLLMQSKLFSFTTSPFNQARRQLKRLKKQQQQIKDPDTQALQLVHLAFNRYAKAPVFAHQLTLFLEKFPEFTDNQKQIENFFVLSSQTLFAKPTQPVSIDALIKLCKQLSRAERLAISAK